MMFRVDPANESKFGCAIPKQCSAEYFDDRIAVEQKNSALDGTGESNDQDNFFVESASSSDISVDSSNEQLM